MFWSYLFQFIGIFRRFAVVMWPSQCLPYAFNVRSNLPYNNPALHTVLQQISNNSYQAPYAVQRQALLQFFNRNNQTNDPASSRQSNENKQILFPVFGVNINQLRNTSALPQQISHYLSNRPAQSSTRFPALQQITNITRDYLTYQTLQIYSSLITGTLQIYGALITQTLLMSHLPHGHPGNRPLMPYPPLLPGHSRIYTGLNQPINLPNLQPPIDLYNRFYALNGSTESLDNGHHGNPSGFALRGHDFHFQSASNSCVSERNNSAEINHIVIGQGGIKREIDDNHSEPPEKMSRHERSATSSGSRGHYSHGSQRQWHPPKRQPSRRNWELVNSGPSYMHNRRWQKQAEETKGYVDFTVASYNVLSQDLLESNPHLYTHCRKMPNVLEWDYRWHHLLREFTDLNADIFCFQEVNSHHFETCFLPELHKLGYYGIYKKRTGDKSDGCAIFFRTSMFEMESYRWVEYKQGGRLDRDNVGIVALLKIKEKNKKLNKNSQRLCVANTHLLFNPKRGDVKLAQLGMLFSVIDRLAHKKKYDPARSKRRYCPIIVCGDMNLEPHCDIYDFMTQGRLKYENLIIAKMSGQHERGKQTALGRDIFPKCLGVTDNCQIINELKMRRNRLQKQTVKKQKYEASKQSKNQKTDQVIVMSDTESSQSEAEVQICEDKIKVKVQDRSGDSSKISSQGHDSTASKLQQRLSPQQDKPSTSSSSKSVTEEDAIEVTFTQNSGTLTHDLSLTSVYDHSRNYQGQMCNEVTTFHSHSACTVDYLMYSVKPKESSGKGSRSQRGVNEDKLLLLSRLSLLTSPEAKYNGHIPNDVISSDHFPLLARFLYKL